MNDDQTPRAHRGRPKGSRNKRTWFAREWALKIGVDPIEFMATVLASNMVEVVKTDADGKVLLDSEGKPLKEFVPVPLDTRIECARTLAQYMYSKLQTTQVVGEGGGPVRVTTLEITKFFEDPDLLGRAQDLALAMV